MAVTMAPQGRPPGFQECHCALRLAQGPVFRGRKFAAAGTLVVCMCAFSLVVVCPGVRGRMPCVHRGVGVLLHLLICCFVQALFRCVRGFQGGTEDDCALGRLLVRGTPVETGTQGKVGHVSHPFTWDRETGQVGVLVPRCRQTDGCPLGSGSWCQGRAWPWLEKVPKGSEAKMEACTGTKPSAWA